jgi:tetratricopeptide (TPR) repeat protein
MSLDPGEFNRPRGKERKRLHRRGLSGWLSRILDAAPKQLLKRVKQGARKIKGWIDRRRPTTRPEVRFRRLLAGIPALVVALFLSGVFYWQKTRAAPAALYRKEVARLTQAKNYSGLLVCLKRLVAIDPLRSDNRLALGSAYAQLGDFDRAEAMMRTIAPAGEPGVPAAHFWLASYSLSRLDQGVWRAADAENHLLLCLKADPANARALALLPKLRFVKAKLSSAILARSATDTYPELKDLIAVRGDRAATEQSAKKIIEQAKKDLAAQPESTRPRYLWANACIALDDYEGALAVFAADGKEKNSADLRRGRAMVCASWIRFLENSKKAKPSEILAVIDRGLQADPSFENFYGHLSQLLRSDETTAKRARERLEDLLASGGPPALIYYTLGNDAWILGRKAESREHFENGHRADPKSPQLANNLAWCLIHTTPEDPKRALTLVNQAISVVPTDPRIRGTRGEVLHRLGRLEEAVQDLEFALEGGDATPQVHAALADCYARLGKPEKAARHRAPR